MDVRIQITGYDNNVHAKHTIIALKMIHKSALTHLHSYGMY